MSGKGRDDFAPVAEGVFFDKDNAPECNFESEDVQSVIEELCGRISVSASPGFTWGRSGNIPSGTWLLNDTVPSNKAGRRVFLSDPLIVRIFVSSEDNATFDIGIYEHTGEGTEVLLHTVSIISSRGGDFPILVTPTSGKELAIRLDSGSAKNPQVGLILVGNL